MFWSLSYELMPDETLIEDSTRQTASGFKPTYTVFLTNKRVIFRFGGMGSSMSQSFFYSDILQAVPVKRLMVNYLAVKTAKKEHYLHTPSPLYWSQKIAHMQKETAAPAPAPAQPAGDRVDRKKQELASMLAALAQNGLLSAEEVEQKKRKLDALRP